MEALFFLIKSLSPGEKRKFRRLYDLPGRNQEYLKLYHSLVRAKTPPAEKKFITKCGSVEKAKRIQSQLIGAVLQFWGQNSDSPKEAIVTMEIAATKAGEFGNLEIMADAIKRGISIAKFAQEYNASKGLVKLWELMPQKYQNEDTELAVSYLRELSELDDQLSSLEMRIKDWPKDRTTPPPKISLLKSIETDIETKTPANIPSTLTPRYYLLKRKILTLQGMMEEAIEVSIQYIHSINRLNLPTFEKEMKILREKRNLAWIFSALGMKDAFFQTSEMLSPIYYSNVISRNRAKVYQCTLNLSFCLDFGLVDKSTSLIETAKEIIYGSDEIEERDLLSILFLLGKYQFLIEDYAGANKTLHQFDIRRSNEKIYSVNHPFVQVVRILSFMERPLPETDSIGQILSTLKKEVKESQLKHQYFSIFFEMVEFYLINGTFYPLEKAEEEKAKIETLKENRFESWPFHRFGLDEWFCSKLKNKPLIEIASSEVKNSPKKYISALSGGSFKKSG